MTSTRPIGQHIIAESVSNWDGLLDMMSRVRPDGAFVLGDASQAMQIKDVCNDGATVIVRDYDPLEDSSTLSFDNAFHQIHPLDQIDNLINHMERKWGNVREELVICFGYNEPSHNDNHPDKTLDKMLEWFIEWAYKTRERGFRVTLGEIATDKTIRGFNHWDVQNGRWDDYIRMLDDMRGWHIPTFHSYTSFVTPFNRIESRGGNSLNRDDVHPDNWDWSPLELTPQFYNGGWVMPPHYNIGREILITHIRAGQLGLDPIPYWITEGDIDSKSNQQGYHEAQKRFKYGNFSPMRGVWGHRGYWAWIHGKSDDEFTDDEFAEFMFLNTKWMIETHPDEMMVLNPFTIAETGEWNVPAGFNRFRPELVAYWEQVIEYHDERETMTQSPIDPVPEIPPLSDNRIPPETDPNWFTGQVKINHGGNSTLIRSTPRKTDSNVLSIRITQDWQDAKFNMGLDWAVSDGLYVWVAIEIDGVQGWASSEHFMIRNQVPVNVPPKENKGCWELFFPSK